MVTERMIINALILGASFILVPFIISEALTAGDYLPALLLILFVGLVISFFFIKDKLAIWPYLGGSVIGSLNFLPLPLDATNIACIFAILYYISGYVIIRQRPIKLGKTAFLWPMVVVVGIVIYHNHSLSLGIFGGNSEGEKPAILLYLTVIAYFCVINLPTPSVYIMSRIPLYSLILTGVTSVPYLLTTFIPGLTPYLYVITSGVNVESYVDSVSAGGGSSFGLAKLAALGPLGSCLQLYLLCYYPIGTWARPERWWVAFLSLICACLVASSGYRSDVFSYFVTIFMATFCHYSWRAIALPVLVSLLGLMLLIASTNNIINLPLRKLPFICQRTLSFLPGDWDPEAIASGKASNDFREGIIDVYTKEYMDKSPWFGNGFSIDVPQFQYWSDPRSAGKDPGYAQSKQFIEGKMFHTGWIGVYDCVGIIGTICFVVFSINLARVNARLLFGPKSDRRSSLYPFYIWVFTGQICSYADYWFVFGSFGSAIIGIIITASLLSHLMDLAAKTEAPVESVRAQGHVEMPRISGAYYGRR